MVNTDPSNAKMRATHIRKTLRSLYPEVKTQLLYDSAFQLLVATILSAQCTDKQVNAATRALFRKFGSPEALARAPLKQIEDLVRPTGFYRNKARNIRNCARTVLERFGGRVPQTLDDLVALPGVGRKTANVVLGAAFGKPGLVVDTHVKRIARRLELTTNSDPARIEADLMRLVPRKEWSDFSLRLIYFGRNICKARKPDCPACPLVRFCPFPHKTVGTDRTETDSRRNSGATIPSE
jgi:endonuclease-3